MTIRGFYLEILGHFHIFTNNKNDKCGDALYAGSGLVSTGRFPNINTGVCILHFDNPPPPLRKCLKFTTQKNQF